MEKSFIVKIFCNYESFVNKIETYKNPENRSKIMILEAMIYGEDQLCNYKKTPWQYIELYVEKMKKIPWLVSNFDFLNDEKKNQTQATFEGWNLYQVHESSKDSV